MNPVVHFEMPYKNSQRMIDFYTQAFGWKTKMLGADMGHYVMVYTTENDAKGMSKKPGMINGGFFKGKPGGKGIGDGPSVVISVKDIAIAMKKVTEAGGKILGKPMEIPKTGMYVGFMDTEDNRVSLIQLFMEM